MRIHMITWLMSLLVVGLYAQGAAYRFPYQLSEPEAEFSLDGDLDEISGLGFSFDENYLLAVQDEDGIVFYLNPATGKVEKKIKFWKDGDYEGIECVNGDVYVVKSTGTLYRSPYNSNEQDSETKKYNSDLLDSSNDVEGITYDAVNHRLLMACKAFGDKANDGSPVKNIMAFDLKTCKVLPQPAYQIKLSAVQNYLGTSPAIRKLEKVIEFFQPGKSNLTFSPSAIALHPLTNDIYLTSSVGKLLLVMAPQGHIRHIEKLNKDIHPQPEGLAFDRQGNLFISNEKRGGKAKIYRFKMQ